MTLFLPPTMFTVCNLKKHEHTNTNGISVKRVQVCDTSYETRMGCHLSRNCLSNVECLISSSLSIAGLVPLIKLIIMALFLI